MRKTQPTSSVPQKVRTSLRQRVRAFYRSFNSQDWQRCFQQVDPRLRNLGKVQRPIYEASLREFQQRYGPLELWHIATSVHPAQRRAGQKADRPFAYVYVFWQDRQHAFHVFRERWVFDNGRWYTRVAGLVAKSDVD